MAHFGHANALRQAKKLGDYLIVGIHCDGMEAWFGSERSEGEGGRGGKRRREAMGSYGIRSNLRVPNFKKVFWESMPPDPPSMCVC